jgi:RimJ/RimL family protein N-acetyltransferase
MDRQPVLMGDRLSLRPLRADDWDALFAAAGDPLIWELHPQHDRWREEVFRGFFADALACGGAVVVVDRQTGAIVGSSRWDRYDPADGGSVEIGWTFLARSHWGGAYNRELKRLMLEHALRFVDRVRFRVGEDNLRSRRAMEKIGARLTGECSVEPTASGMVRHLVFEIERADFAAGPLSSAGSASAGDSVRARRFRG